MTSVSSASKRGLTSSSSQHHTWSFIVAVDIVHQVMTGQSPEKVQSVSASNQHSGPEKTLFDQCCSTSEAVSIIVTTLSALKKQLC